MIDAAFIWQILPQLLQAAGTTLILASSAAAIGFIGGTLLGIAQSRGNTLLKVAVTLYVTIIRGTPLLLQIMFLFLLIAGLGIQISPLQTAIIAIGINSSAYISQIVRSGIQSVSRGQIEAAQTLGVKSFDITRYIILPQALRIVIPALGNELVTLIKESSLASTIGVLELFRRGEIIISQAYNSLTVYAIVGLIYLAMTSIVSLCVLKIEHSLNNHARN